MEEGRPSSVLSSSPSPTPPLVQAGVATGSAAAACVHPYLSVCRSLAHPLSQTHMHMHTNKHAGEVTGSAAAACVVVCVSH